MHKHKFVEYKDEGSQIITVCECGEKKIVSKEEYTKMRAEKRARIMLLSERVKILLGFCYDLKDDIDLLEETGQYLGERRSMALSMAPILTAGGMDYEEISFQNEYRAKRVRGLITFIKTLVDTEEEIKKHKEEQAEKKKGREMLQKLFNQ